uniref:Uncharacterized protein n=1 Tax=Anopheles maculatus TaxID=74869 RepID=A0A182SUV8_9DIPT
TQSEEPSSTEYVTEAIENVTEQNDSATPYQLSFTDHNELVFGLPAGKMEEPSNDNASTDSNRTIIPIFTSLNASVGLRIKAPSLPTATEYTFNELDYNFSSYNYDYESLLRAARNSSAQNFSVVHHVNSLINPFRGSPYGSPFQAPAFMPVNNVGPNSIYTYKDNPNTEAKSSPPQVLSLFTGFQPRIGGRNVERSPVKDSSTTARTKRFRTIASGATKIVISNKKRTQTTKRSRKQTSTTTSSSGSKRFRAVVHHSGPAVKSHIQSIATSTRKLRSRTTAVRGKQFRSVVNRRTRTPRRRRPTKTRRFRNLRRTKPTIRNTPIARPRRLRKPTHRPRIVRPQFLDYDFIYF